MKNVVTVIDMGASKIICCIARIVDEKHFNLLGVGYCACSGMKSGIILDMDSVKKSVAVAVENAEKMAKMRVYSVCLSVSGKCIKSHIVNISLDIGGRVVTDADLANIFDDFGKNFGRDEEIIHLVPMSYSIDSLGNVKNPIGMVAKNLNVSISAVTAAGAQLENLSLCLEKCHLEMDDVIATGYASGIYAIEDADPSSNQIVIDLGGNVTSIAFFSSGVFCGIENVYLGGKNITNDIAYGLNISMENAERLKTLYGSAVVSIADENEMIFVPVNEKDDMISLEQMPKAVLNRIVRARVVEILEKVKAKLDRSSFCKNFSREVIICGGGSQLMGIRDLASEILQKKVKIKQINDFIDGIDVQINNDFSVCFGMIKLLQKNDQNFPSPKKQTHRVTNVGFVRKILSWVENNL